MVIKAVHGLEAEDHVQAIGEDEEHEEGGEQPHPDTRREEAGTVTGVGELLTCHIESLNLGKHTDVSQKRSCGSTQMGGPESGTVHIPDRQHRTGLSTTSPSYVETLQVLPPPPLVPCYYQPASPPEALPLPIPYLEVLKSHLPQGGLRAGYEETALLAQTADILAVKGVDAGPCDLGSIEVDDRAIGVDFEAIHGKPVPGRYWVEAVSQNEPRGGVRGVRQAGETETTAAPTYTLTILRTHLSFIYLLSSFAVLGIEPRASCMLSTCYTTELQPQPNLFTFSHPKIRDTFFSLSYSDE